MCSLNNPARPFCEVNRPGKPAYLTLVAAGTNPCEREGSYPAVDEKTGDLYVAYEFNWFSSMVSAVCTRHINRVQEVLDRVPSQCLTRTTIARCGVDGQAKVPITSMEAAPPPGYSRPDMNDFPRIAVSGQYGTVSMVWNDATQNPMGVILLQSFRLKSLAAVQRKPVHIGHPGLEQGDFMPAIRNTNASGLLDITWYNDEWSAGEQPLPLTTVQVVTDVSPLTSTGQQITGGLTRQGTDWTKTTSDINPNFGDYIDNYVDGSTLYAAWSDGEIGIPQPFEAHIPA
jgi:hypothetical protein